MFTLKRSLFVLLLGAIALLATACTVKPNDPTSIPWSRPADWEGRVPGMGG
jgi:hypothetical protein